jgi:hypothetical protein
MGRGGKAEAIEIADIERVGLDGFLEERGLSFEARRRIFEASAIRLRKTDPHLDHFSALKDNLLFKAIRLREGDTELEELGEALMSHLVYAYPRGTISATISLYDFAGIRDLTLAEKDAPAIGKEILPFLVSLIESLPAKIDKYSEEEEWDSLVRELWKEITPPAFKRASKFLASFKGHDQLSFLCLAGISEISNPALASIYSNITSSYPEAHITLSANEIFETLEKVFDSGHSLERLKVQKVACLVARHYPEAIHKFNFEELDYGDRILVSWWFENTPELLVQAGLTMEDITRSLAKPL